MEVIGNSNLFLELIKHGIDINSYLEQTYNAYIDDDEYIVFKEPRLYTLFILTYSDFIY